MDKMKNQIKRIIYLLSCIAGVLLFIGCKSDNDKIIGEWSGMSSGNNPHAIILTFDKTNHAIITIGSAEIGNGAIKYKGRKVELTYKIDYSKVPFAVDYTMVVDGNPNKESFAKGIFRFITENKMEIRLWLGDEHKYTAFDSNDKENQIVLVRK